MGGELPPPPRTDPLPRHQDIQFPGTVFEVDCELWNKYMFAVLTALLVLDPLS